jgi:predicted XRE-type DNA-binding protein
MNAELSFDNAGKYANISEGGLAMNNDDFELVHGSGNVFRDFGVPNADLEQARAILAAKIIGVLDERKLSVRAAEKLTGIAASEFSRIRNVKLGRFTLDRMMTILGKLDQNIRVSIGIKPRRRAKAA